MSKPLRQFPRRKFSIIYADPPWHYKGQKMHAGTGKKDTGGAVSHYDVMPLAELKALPIDDICEPDTLLFLWATSPHLDQAIELGKSWDFDWATVAFVWNKDRVNPGFYTMSQVELCLVMKRGRIPSPRGARNVKQMVNAPRQDHSTKPIEVMRRIEAMFPTQKKIELFARTKRPGWTPWGVEV